MGLNKHTYETKYKVLDINVLEKQNLTRYEVNLKIDNLNVEDTFGRNRTEKLLDIFRSASRPIYTFYKVYICFHFSPHYINTRYTIFQKQTLDDCHGFVCHFSGFSGRTRCTFTP